MHSNQKKHKKVNDISYKGNCLDIMHLMKPKINLSQAKFSTSLRKYKAVKVKEHEKFSLIPWIPKKGGNFL